MEKQKSELTVDNRGSWQGAFMSHSIARTFSIDTSRAKTNAQVVSLCAQQLGLQEYPEGRSDGKPCDIYWHNVVYQDMKAIVADVNARVNKFPGMTDLSKKISLSRAIASMRRLFPDEYEFYPKSWFLPAQLDEFIDYCDSIYVSADEEDCAEPQPKWFIVKPDDGAQGTGIYLINSPSQLKDTSAKQLIQEYIADPFLMGDGLKFDFRVYAVIKSINPLSLHVAREGMARFCTEKYSKPSTSNFDNLYAHLTNYSLNKANNHYVHSNSLQDQLKGSKRLLSTVFHQMEARGVKTKRLWHNIKLIIVKTILAMVPEIMLSYEHYFYDAPGPQCFQIMGFDILVTKELKPILLEVNSAPSLTIDHTLPMPNEEEIENVEPPRIRSVVDEVIKIPLVMDTILLVLDLIDDVYSARSISTMSVLSDRGNSAKKAADDMIALSIKRKSHLSEIFPCRYGQCSGHLLFLDKAVYLFMQFVNLKQTSFMTISGARTFVRKCNLMNVITIPDLERKFSEIYCHFTGEQYTSFTSGLTFHGFLTLIYEIAQFKFPLCDDLLGSVQRLLAYCDVSLRHYGVRSARLRRTQIDNDKENSVEIYLLPTRLKEKRTSRTQIRSKSDGNRKGRSRYGRSLPRTININTPTALSEEMSTGKIANNKHNSRLVLPKIKPPFLV
uniref:Tubulin polyglutamylase TTLL11 n=1 Tax=Ascaris suum TaxID=6253 RepID=F1KX28_ASCSU